MQFSEALYIYNFGENLLVSTGFGSSLKMLQSSVLTDFPFQCGGLRTWLDFQLLFTDEAAFLLQIGKKTEKICDLHGENESLFFSAGLCAICCSKTKQMLLIEVF